MIVGNKEFKDRTYIMGILNVTPDSFSDGGIYNSVDKALFHVEEMIKDGADIIDVGGESTRPGYTKIGVSEEIHRVSPVIEKIKSRFDIPVSIDTYKPAVAKAAVRSGADMINDIWGFKYDKTMALIAAQDDVACCLTHNSETGVYNGDFIECVKNELQESIDIAVEAGVDKNKILLDPGVGFGKSYEQNLEIIKRCEEFEMGGYPYMLAASKKSVIGLTIDLPIADRTEATVATTVMAVMKNALFVRVHDIKENKRAILMTEKVLGRW